MLLLKISGIHYIMKFVAVLGLFLSTVTMADVDLVTVDKSERIMSLYDGSELIAQYAIALGANPKGHKAMEGDERTPEGRYILDYIKNDSSFYRAMHINYPSSEDTRKASEAGVSAGGFIMVHGQKNFLGWLSVFTQKFNWTNGCIALKNSEIDEFLELVPVGTQIIIQW